VPLCRSQPRCIAQISIVKTAGMRSYEALSMQASYAYTFRGDKQVPVVSLPVLAVSGFAVLKEYKSLWVICLAVSS